MRLQFSVSLLLSLITLPAQAQLSYPDVKGIIDDNCVVCHAAGGVVDALPFQSLDQIRSKAERMKAAITTVACRSVIRTLQAPRTVSFFWNGSAVARIFTRRPSRNHRH